MKMRKYKRGLSNCLVAMSLAPLLAKKLVPVLAKQLVPLLLRTLVLQLVVTLVPLLDRYKCSRLQPLGLSGPLRRRSENHLDMILYTPQPQLIGPSTMMKCPSRYESYGSSD